MTPPDALRLQAQALLDRGEASGALRLLEAARAGESDHVGVILAYLDALEQTGRRDEALELVRRAALRVDDPGLSIRGAGLAVATDDRAARDAFLASASARFPGSSLVLAALADAASDDGDSDRAIELRTRAIAAHDPRKGAPVDLYLALNSELTKVGRPREGHALLVDADRRAATKPVVHSARLMTAHYYLPELGASEPERAAVLEAFREDHRRFGDRFGVPIATQCRSQPWDGRRKLRIGYVSPDLRDHSVARFFVPILRAHDRERFEVFCYSTTDAPRDATTELVASLATKLVDLRGLGPGPAAAKLAEDALDVVVDLAGHTGPDQLVVLARRVAPVQLSFLGYPDVTGLPELDGFITDAVASPPEADAYAVEPLLRLPHTAWTFDPQVEPLETERASSTGIVFGALHNLAKITDGMLAVWAQILDRVPGSTLTVSFRTRSDEGRRVFAARLAAAGLGTDRVSVLAPVPERRAHVERLRAIDVVLDTFPYAGTTTTCEALWMGVPVVTLAGTTHASRVGASLVSAVGLDDLVTRSTEAYVEVAVALAKDAPHRAELRTTLRSRLCASPLGDAAAFTRSLEALYVRTYRERAALPGFDLVATGVGRFATVDGARVVLPRDLVDPASFEAIERGRVDDGELAFVRGLLPAGSTCLDVLPGAGIHAVSLARAASGSNVVHAFEPMPTPTSDATLRAAPNVRVSAVLPGQRRGRASLGPRSVEVAPLDALVQEDAALLRLGAPGLEAEVLRGASRHLAKGALVLLERGFQPLGPAAGVLTSLGLEAYGWVPMLGGLARVDPDDPRRALFAVSPACRARFGASLAILDDAAPAATTPGTEHASASSVVRGGAGVPWSPAVAAFAHAASPELSPAQRLASLRGAIEAGEREVAARPRDVGARLTLCRALVELGSLGRAGAVIEPLMAAIDAPLGAAMNAPFVPALPRYDALAATDPEAWLLAQVLEAFVKLSAPSSFFHPPDFLELFARFDRLGFPDREMDRREALLRSRKEL